MGYLMGIDVATTGTKCIIADEDGRIVSSATTEYPLLSPHPGWAEQDPGDWWDATVSSIRGSLTQAGIGGESIDGIGLTGQMHSSVFLNERWEVLRPAILWCDQRTGEQVDEIHRLFGRERFIHLTCNPVLTGFTLPKILWLREREPQTYRKVKKLLLPKDYIRFKLTGEFATDVSDASGTSLFNIRERRWSDEVADGLEIDKNLFPRVYESSHITGRITQSAAELTGLKAGIPVVAGAGDQAASALSCGIYREGVVSVTLGTSGVVFASTDTVKIAPDGKLHSFCHAVEGKWHLMGVMLSAGGSFKWICESLGSKEMKEAEGPQKSLYDIMTQEAEEVPAGSEGLVFLPYLTGERTPHQDPHARGVFFGLSLRHTRAHLIRAVMEGVGFGLKDSLKLLKDVGIEIEQIRLVGGGAKSKLWRSILADIFESPIHTLQVEAGAPYGALLLAGVGVGTYKNVEDACRVMKTGTVEALGVENKPLYRDLYALYRRLYLDLKDSFREISKALSESKQ